MKKVLKVIGIIFVIMIICASLVCAFYFYNNSLNEAEKNKKEIENLNNQIKELEEEKNEFEKLYNNEVNDNRDNLQELTNLKMLLVSKYKESIPNLNSIHLEKIEKKKIENFNESKVIKEYDYSVLSGSEWMYNDIVVINSFEELIAYDIEAKSNIFYEESFFNNKKLIIIPFHFSNGGMYLGEVKASKISDNAVYIKVKTITNNTEMATMVVSSENVGIEIDKDINEYYFD